MSDLVQDVRLALRSFWKAPVFTLGAILTLTLAIGANTAIFSLLNALVLRDLPVREPSSLVSLARATRASADGAFSLPMFRMLAERQQSLSALVGWTSNAVINVEIDGVRARGNVSAVTGNYFTELGIRPVAGRVLTEADVDLGTQQSAPVAVIGHGFWQRHFNRDPAAVGRTIRVEGTPFTVVGVAPSGFRGLGLTLEIDVAVPLTFVPIVRDVTSRAFLTGTTSSPISLTGRLRPGVTIDRARAELTALWPAVLTAVMPADHTAAQRERFLETTIQVREGAKGVEPGLRRRFTQPLVIVMAIALFVVLIACVNIASLMMSRASSRMHEMGVRLALGAGSWRLMRHVLVEGVLLSLVGALFGVLLAMWGSESLVAVILSTSTVPPSFDVRPDFRVMAFTISLALLVGLLFSVAPAWRVGRASAAAALQRSTRTATRSGRAGRILVAIQVGLSLVLLINGGLLVRSLQAIRAVDSGLRTDDVFVVYPAPRPGGYQKVDHDSYYPAVLQRLAAIPGVRDVGASLSKPAAGAGATPEPVSRVGDTAGSSEVPAIRSSVSPGFFATFGVPVLAGRDFDWRDHSRSRRVAVISRSLADRLSGEGAAVGQRIRMGVAPENQDVEVVGVVADARLYNLKEDNVAAAYVPALQTPDPGGKCYVIGGRGVSIGAVQQAVESLGVELINSPAESLDFIVGRALLQERLVAAFAAFFGALALLMAGIGLYGLTSYHVNERRREIGIRMALGADASRVMRRVVGDAVQVTAAGVLAGGIAALAAAQVLRTLLFGVSTYDPVTMIAAPALLLMTTLFACLGPAARAARVDPILTLRAE